MDDEKKKKLEAAGFQVGSVAEFLQLSPKEQKLVENVVVRHGKPLGICVCKGLGKGRCQGNGWINDKDKFTPCKYLKPFDKMDIVK